MSRGAVDGELRERRLSAILAADVVGYSKLMGADEVETLSALRSHRRELIDPTITSHRGRIVKTTGDGMLVEFASAVDAVRCAVDVQRGMAERNEAVPSEKRIKFRIGINVGDIIAVGGDIYGDGVNVAARLEAMSEPGDTYVSRTVRDPVRDKLAFSFEDLGEISAKNIARPIHVFRVRHDTESGRKGFASPLVVRRLVIAVIAALVVVGASAGAWFWRTRASSAVPPPLSLVVLPFDNLGSDTGDNSTADGITEDLTTLLAQFADSSVISRNTAFAYRGKPIDIKRIGDELGVRYAAEGSVRRIDSTLRINVQLVSTETGTHLWADHFDIGRDGGGNNVDDVVREIGLAFYREILDIEAARSARERPTNPSGFDLLLQARALKIGRPHSPDLEKQILALFEGAVRLDPSLATALAGVAETLLDSHSSEAEDPAMPAIFHQAEELVTKAELLQPQNPKVMWTRVYLLARENRCGEVIPAARRTIELYPIDSGAYFRMGLCQLWDGRATEAISTFEQAIRADPRNPQNFNRYGNIGRALLFLDRYDEAVPWFQRSLAANPSVENRGDILAALAAARALGGHTEEAHTDADEVIRLWPTLTARSYYRRKLTSPVAVAQVSRMLDGLRQAGIRDHADEDADFNRPSDEVLHTNYEAHTPTTARGAQTIRTHDLAIMLDQHKPLVIDASTPWGQSVPGAIGLWGVGAGGSVTDEYQGRLGSKIQKLTHGDQKMPVVVIGWNAERYQGRNLALRLVALGYENVYWYRGGREAWEVAGLPETELAMQDW
jgi:adenylate cyclase